MPNPDRLAQHLNALGTHAKAFSFAELEEVLQTPLPADARLDKLWWKNAKPQDLSKWQQFCGGAGWECSYFSVRHGVAIFRSLAPLPELTEALTDEEAEEGYLRDGRVVLRGRNARLAERCKTRDNSTCQACGFRLMVGTKPVIEVHHLNPLSISGIQRTKLAQLVALCPTCHRIAHLRRRPYEVHEIRALRAEAAPNPSFQPTAYGGG